MRENINDGTSKRKRSKGTFVINYWWPQVCMCPNGTLSPIAQLARSLAFRLIITEGVQTEVMFIPLFVCLSVCLSVCEQDISKSCARIQTKFGGQVGCGTRTNWLDVGEDPDPDPDAGIFKVILHHRVMRLKRYLKKLWTDSDETWWTGWVCNKDELIRF